MCQHQRPTNLVYGKCKLEGNEPRYGNWRDFSFSTIGMAGWMCYSSVNCTNACPNNSAAEGEQFYQLFTSSSNSPAAYILTGIQSCNGAEGVAPGTDPDDQNSGQTDIEKHMKNNCHH